MAQQFDLVVLGAGTAARGTAMRVRAARWSIAVVDCKHYGGTCALRGCDPKKMLIGEVSVIDHARRMHGKGVAGDVHIDWPDLMAFKRGFTDPVPYKQVKRVARLLDPVPIAYSEAIATAAVGLAVNLVSAWLLRAEHGHGGHVHGHAQGDGH